MDAGQEDRYRKVGQKARALSRHLQAGSDVMARRIKELDELVASGRGDARDKEELRFLREVIIPPHDAAVMDWNTILLLSGMSKDKD